MFVFSGSVAYFNANPECYRPFLDFQVCAGRSTPTSRPSGLVSAGALGLGPAVEGEFRNVSDWGCGFSSEALCCRVWIRGFGFRAWGPRFRARGLERIFG